jgi:FAD-dependent urate hydroxylase
MTDTCDVAIVGAGPYGLAARAELRGSSLDIRQFGEPMSFWRKRMPEGMRIRSPWVATNFGPETNGLTLDDFERIEGAREHPLMIDGFLEYGDWYARQVAPDVDRRWVSRIAGAEEGFELTLADGTNVHARRVVVAAGIDPFGRRPAPFDKLPAELAAHSTRQEPFATRVGQKVIVVGAGQSGLESAALLHEAGVDVEVLVRAPRVHWLARSHKLHALGPVSKLFYAPADIGPAGISRLVAMPGTLRCLPRGLQDRAGARAIRPAGSAWLIERLANVKITTSTAVTAAHEDGSRVRLTLSDGSTRVADHVVLGTGFDIDISRYGFIAPELCVAMQRIGGYPVLGRGFESSIPGLHFLGAPAAVSYGPIMRFVAGSPYAAPRLAQAIVADAPRRALEARPALEAA